MKYFRKIFLAFLMIGMLATYIGVTNFAFADDDEEDRYEESEDDEDEKNDDEEDDKEEAITEIIRLPDKYVTKTIIENIIKKDSDRDGIIDEKDLHPNIAEIYIVNDQNQNGIDDKYDLNAYEEGV